MIWQDYLKKIVLYIHFHRIIGEIFDVNKHFSINNCNDLARLPKENWTLHTFSQNRRNI